LIPRSLLRGDIITEASKRGGDRSEIARTSGGSRGATPGSLQAHRGTSAVKGCWRQWFHTSVQGMRGWSRVAPGQAFHCAPRWSCPRQCRAPGDDRFVARERAQTQQVGDQGQ